MDPDVNQLVCCVLVSSLDLTYRPHRHHEPHSYPTRSGVKGRKQTSANMLPVTLKITQARYWETKLQIVGQKKRILPNVWWSKQQTKPILPWIMICGVVLYFILYIVYWGDLTARNQRCSQKYHRNHPPCDCDHWITSASTTWPPPEIGRLKEEKTHGVNFSEILLHGSCVFLFF